jgi:hypothetical protein
MSKYELVFRRTKGSPVTSDEIDNNFKTIQDGLTSSDIRISKLENVNLDFVTHPQLEIQVTRLDGEVTRLDSEVTRLDGRIDEIGDNNYGDDDVQLYLTANDYVNQNWVYTNFDDLLTPEERTVHFNNRFSEKSTDDLKEGETNLYYTDARVDERVSDFVEAGSNISLVYNEETDKLTISATGELGFDLSSNTTTDLKEGANEYYTDDKVQTVIDTNTAGFITSVTETDVTQHQESLSITESQISDLKGYLLDDDLEPIRIRLSTAEDRISALEGNNDPAVYEIAAPDTVTAGSSGIDDDVVVISTNASANSKFRFVVKYELSTGITSQILNQNDRQINYSLESKYDLNIPWHREYNGAKIDKVIIEVYDDPNLAEPRTEVLVTKTIDVLDAPKYFIANNTSEIIDESETVTVTVTTANIFNGSELQYTINGLTEEDTSTPLSGTLTLSNVDANNGTGSVQFDIVTLNDLTTEGDETVTVDISYNSLQETITFELLDTSRATETITIENWIDEVVINQGGNTIADKQVLVDIYNTFRTDLLALTSPSDLGMTMTEVYLLLIKKSWIDNATLIPLDTSDNAWLASVNAISGTYNSDIRAAGVVNDIHTSSPMMPRPSDGTREDDVAYSFVYNNPTVTLTLQTVLYTSIEEKPV